MAPEATFGLRCPPRDTDRDTDRDTERDTERETERCACACAWCLDELEWPWWRLRDRPRERLRDLPRDLLRDRLREWQWQWPHATGAGAGAGALFLAAFLERLLLTTATVATVATVRLRTMRRPNIVGAAGCGRAYLCGAHQWPRERVLAIGHMPSGRLVGGVGPCPITWTCEQH